MIFLFDMGGVVSNSTNLKNICEELNLRESEYYSFQRDSAGCNTYQLLNKGVINVEDYWKNFSENSKIEIKTDYFKTLYKPVLNESVVSIIKKLKNKNNRVVCGTNTIESHFEEHKRLRNYDFFDTVYSSHLMGVEKPAPDFFTKIIAAEQVLASEIFFIDDNKMNIDAAEKIGIRTKMFVSVEILEKELAEYI
jgi:putative hydrolase of the HAD superfamily